MIFGYYNPSENTLPFFNIFFSFGDFIKSISSLCNDYEFTTQSSLVTIHNKDTKSICMRNVMICSLTLIKILGESVFEIRQKIRSQIFSSYENVGANLKYLGTKKVRLVYF